MNNLLITQENHAIMPSVIQVSRDDLKRRHDLLLAEIQQLREWLGYRPIATRAHQRELREQVNEHLDDRRIGVAASDCRSDTAR